MTRHPGWRSARTARLTTTQRGYGKGHVKARAAAARQHHPSDPCARCGHALGPMGPWLHYDHNTDRTGYLGFSHGRHRCPVCRRRCNEHAAARAGAARTNRQQQVTTPTLRW